jgi:hypothetical protein
VMAGGGVFSMVMACESLAVQPPVPVTVTL